MDRNYHWAERWRWLHGPDDSYMRRRTDGTVASSYLEAADIEAAERGITRWQFLHTQKYKWLTLAEVTPPVESTQLEIPTAAAGAEVTSSPASSSAAGESGASEAVDEVKSPSPSPGYATVPPIGNAHYDRMGLMSAQISIGSALIVLGVALAVLTGLPVLLPLACAALGGALLTLGLSNIRKPQ